MAAAPRPSGRPIRLRTLPAIVRGVFLMLGATALFVTMNTIVKTMSAHLPVLELVWARTLGHLLFVIALFAPGHGGLPGLFVTRRPLIQVSRSVLLVGSTTAFFFAIGHVPLADATTVSFSAPIIVAVLAGPLLGERVTAAHWAAIAVGFAGALLVIRPTGAGGDPYALLVLLSATCYAGYQLLTRRVSAFDPPETSVTYSALVGTLLLSAVVPFSWQTPERWTHVAALGALGLLGGLGHYAVARAFALGPASIISPFHYVQLIWAAAAGYLVFGDVPELWTWLGAAFIIGSGLFIAFREARRDRVSAPADTTPTRHGP